MIAKLHGLSVTGADLHYEGSIALDPEWCEAIGLMPFEFVEIWNKSSGARISTYVIHAEPGSRACVLNGAAARTCQAGDELIIAARADVPVEQVNSLRPRVAIFSRANEIVEIVQYEFVRRASGALTVRRAAQPVQTELVAECASGVVCQHASR